MQFEFDSQKNELNTTKHGIDFIAAQQLWVNLNRVVLTLSLNAPSDLAKSREESMWISPHG
jgi:uncharacterized DUF497 family protein